MIAWVLTLGDYECEVVIGVFTSPKLAFDTFLAQPVKATDTLAEYYNLTSWDLDGGERRKVITRYTERTHTYRDIAGVPMVYRGVTNPRAYDYDLVSDLTTFEW